MIEFKSMTSHPYNPGQPDGNNHSLTIQPNVEKDKTSAKFAVMLRQLNAVIRYIGDLELGYGKNETKSTRIENDLDGIVPKCISVKNQTASTELIPLKTSDSAARHNANESLPAHLSKGLIKAITPEMFAKDVNIETLTSPDDQGIRCNNQQKKFLELNGNFLEITKLNENRYRAKTSLMLPDLYIRYKNNKFEVESLAERLKNILTVGLSGRAMRRKDTGQLSKKRFNTLDETTNAEQLPKRMRKHISSVDIAEKNEIRPTSLKQNAKSDGRPTEKGFARVSKFERNKNGHVNFDLVERWQKMSQQERDNITQAEFAREHNIHVGRWIDMVDKNGGLKSTGLRIKMQSEGIAFKPITAEICSEWRNFTQAKRDQITRNGFAEERTINPEIWERYVKKDGQLTFFGKNKLSNLSGDVFRPITPNILIYWRNLSQEQRNTITMKGFASKRGINYLKLSQLVTIDGQLQPNGSVMVDKANGVDFKPITEPLIIAWQNLSQEERDETTMNGYAKMHNFNARQWYKTINIRGELGVMGHSIIDKERGVVYQPILKRHLKKWQAMTHRQRDQIGVIEYAVHNKLSPQHWANCVKVAGGLQPRYTVAITKKNSHSPHPRMAALPDVIILLKNDFSLIEQREINNDSPILRDAENFYKSILVQEEGDIKQIKISGWFYVNTLIQSLPKSDRQRVRLEIRKNIRIWLHAEGQHTDLFNALMEARLPEGDDGPARGKTVYAKRDIKQFEVLGPYAGILHTSEDSLQKEKRKIGEKLVLSYLWEPYATDRTVSGFQQGNMLSLINTSQLSNSSPVWKHNNVGVIWVGKNLIFYVALENIEKGEELLVDYGGTYNPTGNDIKQESLALAES